LTGCGPSPSLPSRDDLILLLGPLDEDVTIIGGSIQPRASSENAPSSEGSPDTVGATKLWVVRSKKALPTPDQIDPVPRSVARVNSAPQFVKQAFSAHVLYDIADALRIHPKELPLPPDGKIDAIKGNLTEWTQSPWTIRIRDCQTDSGWFSIVEAIADQVH
jgi:hypothetical protein